MKLPVSNSLELTVDEMTISGDGLVALDGALLHHGNEDAGEEDERVLEKVIGLVKAACVPCVPGGVELGDGEAVRPVGQLAEVLAGLVLGGVADEPVVLVGAEGKVVDHEEHAHGVGVGGEAEDDLAELEGGAVAGARGDVGEVAEERDEEGSNDGKNICT